MTGEDQVSIWIEASTLLRTAETRYTSLTGALIVAICGKVILAENAVAYRGMPSSSENNGHVRSFRTILWHYRYHVLVHVMELYEEVNV